MDSNPGIDSYSFVSEKYRLPLFQAESLPVTSKEWVNTGYNIQEHG